VEKEKPGVIPQGTAKVFLSPITIKKAGPRFPSATGTIEKKREVKKKRVDSQVVKVEKGTTAL